MLDEIITIVPSNDLSEVIEVSLCTPLLVLFVQDTITCSWHDLDVSHTVMRVLWYNMVGIAANKNIYYLYIS